MLTEMVMAGEQTWGVAQDFLRLADRYRNLVRMKRVFLQRITWRVLQLIAAVVVLSVFFILLYVLESQISELRAPDRFTFMLGLSPLAKLLLFWGLLLLFALGLFAALTGIRSGWFGPLPIKVALAVPLPGSTIMALAMSRFAWSFGMAADSGMDAPEAMRLGLHITQNCFYVMHESAITRSIAGGQEFFRTLHQINVFPDDRLQALLTKALNDCRKTTGNSQ